MDWNEELGGLMESLGLNSDAVNAIMQQYPEIDFNALAAEAAAQGAFGGMANMFAGMEGMFGETEYDEIDLDEEVARYAPAAEDAADRAFLAALKDWLKTAIGEIPDSDVCALEIGYHAVFGDEALEKPVYLIWISYNTERTKAKNIERFGENVWNWINWTKDEFRTLPDAPFAAWRNAQGYDEENDGDEMIERIYDLAVAAVMELHAEQFTEQRFGRKIPFIIEDYEYYQKTAIRAVKANGGTELFDSAFFAECGFTDDDEEDAENESESQQ
ncbi:MAG: hypothetical protein IKQ39_01830 [Oscillospiraceae bacterium]|nr:hypothetical protein [Oscillospiraceae bacterium]